MYLASTTQLDALLGQQGPNLGRSPPSRLAAEIGRWAKRSTDVSAKGPEVGNGWRPPAAKPASAVQNRPWCDQSDPPGSGPALPQTKGGKKKKKNRHPGQGSEKWSWPSPAEFACARAAAPAGAIASRASRNPQSCHSMRLTKRPARIGVVIGMADVGRHCGHPNRESALTRPGRPGQINWRIAVGVLIAASARQAHCGPPGAGLKVRDRPQTPMCCPVEANPPSPVWPWCSRSDLRAAAGAQPKPPRCSDEGSGRRSSGQGRRFPCAKTGCPSWPSW